jgi:hypothetical protein
VAGTSHVGLESHILTNSGWLEHHMSGWNITVSGWNPKSSLTVGGWNIACRAGTLPFRAGIPNPH